MPAFFLAYAIKWVSGSLDGEHEPQKARPQLLQW
jgi:hypothetical protein